MQTNFDQEMDKLLRAHGADTSRVQKNSLETDAHLDADTLSAYIENALPVATRSLYTAHLTDCAACRRLAVALVQTLPVASEEVAPEKIAFGQTASEQTTLSKSFVGQIANETNWRARLAAFFSPSFLRYAVPVLVIGIVGVVTFIAFNSSQRRADNLQDVAMSDKSVASRVENINSPLVAATQSASNANSSIVAKTETKQTATNISPAKTAPQSTAAVNESQDAARKDERGQASETVVLTSQPATPDANSTPGAQQVTQAAPTAKNANPTEDELTRIERKQQNEPAPQAQNAQTANAETRAADEANKSNNDVAMVAGASGSGGVATAKARRSAPMTAKKPDVKGGEKSERDVQTDSRLKTSNETRRIAGHQFARQNGAWVDTAYNSQRIINVARDSEQFRALASDEPEVRRIATELGGTVIIVIKGRAYRIH